ncbi:hypothetical protein JCM1841_001732 [Sporobolomyces salmonicolor]
MSTASATTAPSSSFGGSSALHETEGQGRGGGDHARRESESQGGTRAGEDNAEQHSTSSQSHSPASNSTQGTFLPTPRGSPAMHGDQGGAFAGGGAKAADASSGGYTASYGYSSAYSHPAYASSQHPLYSRPLPSSSAYSTHAANASQVRPTYAPYNYQSPYSRPLSSSGPSSTGTTAAGQLPPMSLSPLPSSAVAQSSSSHLSAPRQWIPNGTGSAPYQQPPSLNPYHHPAYVSSHSQHTYQHPIYARSSLPFSTGSNSVGYPPPLNAHSNPYSHPALPPPPPPQPASTSAPNSPWSGPPPPPLSLSSGSVLLSKRRRSNSHTLGHGPQASGMIRPASQQEQGEEEERDELEEEDDEEERRSRGSREGGLPEEEREAGDELAPAVGERGARKRARTSSGDAIEFASGSAAAGAGGVLLPKPQSAGMSKGAVIKAKTGGGASGSGPGSGSPKNGGIGEGEDGRDRQPPEKKFICPHPSCGRAFARHFNLNSHIKSHQGIREYKCPECSKLFSRKHDCTRHCIAIHHYDKDSGKAPVFQPQQRQALPSLAMTMQQPSQIPPHPLQHPSQPQQSLAMLLAQPHPSRPATGATPLVPMPSPRGRET